MAETKRGRGRPRLPQDERSGKRVAYRITDAELDELTRAAEQDDQKVGDFARDAALERARRVNLRTR